MPRYDDRYGNTRLYVGHLASRTQTRDLDRIFSRYGKVRDVDMKREFAFVEFYDPRDADDARYSLDGRDVDGSCLIVEFAKGAPRGSRDREYMGRGPPPGSGRCFNCGIDGHWARDCKAGDWKNKCYRCGERGHIERQCKNSPKELRHERSRSRSPRRGRSRSPSYSRSYSRSRSPPRRERSLERDDRSRSPVYRGCNLSMSPVPSKGRKRSPTPEDYSPRGRASLSPRNDSLSPIDGDKSPTPKSRSPSPAPKSRSPSPTPKSRSPSPAPKSRSPSPAPKSRSPSPAPKSRSPSYASKSRSPSPTPKSRSTSPVREIDSPAHPSANGHSLSPREDRNPVDEDEDDNRRSP